MDARFFIPTNLLLEAGSIEMEIEVAKTFDFGPAEFPPLIASTSVGQKILDFGKSNEIASQLTRQIDIGLPFVITSLALVIDHTNTLPYLALFSGLSSVSTVPAGSPSKAVLVGAKIVKGPSPLSVVTRSAAFTAATRVL